MKRLGAAAASLQRLLELEDNAPALLDRMLELDGRFETFKLEAALKLYGQVYKGLEKPLAQAKTLEDRLGEYKVAEDLVEAAERYDLPADAIDRLQKAKLKQRAETETELERWLPEDGALQSILKKADKVDWKKGDRDRKALAQTFAKHIKRIEKRDYQFEDDLEAVHDLRKDLRWIVLYSLGAEGLITLSGKEGEPPAPAGAEKYAALPAAHERKRAVRIPRELHMRLLEGITALGQIKDALELRDALADAMDMKTSKARALVAEKMGLPEDVEAQAKATAHQLHGALVKDGLLKALRKHFEAGVR